MDKVDFRSFPVVYTNSEKNSSRQIHLPVLLEIWLAIKTVDWKSSKKNDLEIIPDKETKFMISSVHENIWKM